MGPQISPDGSRLLLFNYKSLLDCDATTGKVLNRLDLPAESREYFGYWANYSPDEKIVYFCKATLGSEETEIWRWKVGEGKSTLVPTELSNITKISWSADGEYSAVVSDLTRLWLCDSDLTPIQALGEHVSPIAKVSFEHDGTLLVSGPPCQTNDADDHVRFWDVEKRAEVFPLPKSATLGAEVAFCPDSSIIAVYGNTPGHFFVWDLDSRRVKRTRGHRGALYSATWSSDGQTLATAGQDASIQLWNREEVAPEAVERTRIRSSRFMRVLPRSVLVSSDSTQAYDTRKLGESVKQQVHVLIGHGEPGDMDLCPGGTLVSLSLEDSNSIDFWRTQDGSKITTLADPEFPVTQYTCVAADPASRRISVGRATSWDNNAGEIVTWVETNGEWEVATRTAVDAMPTKMVYASDSRLFIAHDLDPTSSFEPVRVWDPSTGKQIVELDQQKRSVTSITLSRDEHYFAVANRNRTARIWDANNYSCLATLRHYHPVFSVAFSPDNSRLVTGTADGWIYFWDWQRQTSVGRIQLGDTTAAAIAFTESGHAMIVGWGDGTTSKYELSNAP